MTGYKVISLLLFQEEHDVNYSGSKKLIFSLDNELLNKGIFLGRSGWR